MRKSVLTATATLIACVVAVPMAYAASTPDTKRACADVVDGRATYFSVPDTTNPTGSQVLAQMDLRANTCKKISYTMTVFGTDGPLTEVPGVPVKATYTTPPRVEFGASLGYPGPDGVVCIVITTTRPDGKVLDRAPDSQCVPLPIDSDVSGAIKFH